MFIMKLVNCGYLLISLFLCVTANQSIENHLPANHKGNDLTLDIDSDGFVESLNGRNNRPVNYNVRRIPDATILDPKNVPTSGPSITSYFRSNSADLIYVEQMVPSEGDRGHIYWSACNFYFGRRGGYAGIQHQVNKVIKGVPFEYNNICSIWDEKDTDPHLPTESKLTYGLEGLHWNHFGGEGTGLHTSHPIDWSTDQWYATVIRRWYIAGENVTRMAMFMYSYSDKKWTHYMSAAVPGIDIPITGNSVTGFLERFTGQAMGYHGIYGQHYRMNTTGSWEKPLYYEARADSNPNFWKAELDQTVNIKLTAGGIFDNTESHIKLHPKQVDPKPKPVVTPIVEFVKAFYVDVNNFAVSVEWKISSKTPPQLSYDIQIRKDDIKGELIAKKSGISPEKRKEKLETGALTSGKYFAIVQFSDIFNQQSNALHAEFIVV